MARVKSQVTLTAELVTTHVVEVEGGDDQHVDAYNAAVDAAEALVKAAFGGKVVAYTYDIQKDDVVFGDE